MYKIILISLMMLIAIPSTQAMAQKALAVDVVATVAKNSQYLAFGDPDHSHLDVYKFVSHPVILHALAQENYRSIAIESPLYMQALIDLYHDEAISKAAFISAADALFDNPFADDITYLNLLADFIDTAKPLDIKIHAVDSAPGIITRKNAAQFHTLTAKVAAVWAKELTRNPAILKKSPQAQQQAMGTVVAPFAKDYLAVAASEQAAQAKGIEMTERYRYDREIAQRIKALSRQGKIAIIYGNLHLERNKNDRMGGDIDYHLGEENVTTINVYYDLEIYKSGNGGELWRRMADPKSQPLFPDEAPLWDQLRSVADRPEYELDLKSGTWLDWGKKKATLVSLP